MVPTDGRQPRIQGDQDRIQRPGRFEPGSARRFGVNLETSAGENQAQKLPDIAIICNNQANTVQIQKVPPTQVP